jgi:hypothetical protein
MWREGRLSTLTRLFATEDRCEYAPFANAGRDLGRDKSLTCTKTYRSNFGLRTFTFPSVPFRPTPQSQDRMKSAKIGYLVLRA